MKSADAGGAGPERRAPLTREQVVASAVELADRNGIGSISMRRLAQELGVEAMSLYTHVRSKDDLLDGMADAVIGVIPLEAGAAGWRAALRRMVLGARDVMLRHPWAPATIETRAVPGPAGLAYVNAVLGVMREGGFSVAEAHHALHILGSRVLGFAQGVFDDSPADSEAAAGLPEEFAAAFPYAAEMALAVTHGGALGPCDDGGEFEFALDFILDGLHRLRQSQPTPPGPTARAG